MDELLKALTEAVKAGTALALPALIGYFLTQILGQVLVAGTVLTIARWIYLLIYQAQQFRWSGEAAAAQVWYKQETARRAKLQSSGVGGVGDF